MMKWMTLTLVVFIINAKCDYTEIVSGNPLIHVHPCIGSDHIVVSYEPGLAPEDENQYGVYITHDFRTQSRIEITLDAYANVTLNDKDYARVFRNDKNYQIRFFKDHDDIGLRIIGIPFSRVPYITSLNINGHEFCSQPLHGYLDEYILGYKDHA
ncbi:uncharacterized protein LOC125072629 [Vanessa atalanta]|uniref:uncharacterized protein LOC125072629 n=1 Tax=Vanessa atalanta TaxID=42275 RepID=UPI001FCD4EB8|nr:uncharacterized protein LOC125072629 [Vanessa atalanta]